MSSSVIRTFGKPPQGAQLGTVHDLSRRVERLVVDLPHHAEPAERLDAHPVDVSRVTQFPPPWVIENSPPPRG